MDTHTHRELERHWDDLVHIATSSAHSLKLTVGEFVFFASFVVNYIAGKIVHFCGPQEQVNNYWNYKGNVVNQLFVKKGWAWTTVVIFMFYALQVRNRRMLTTSMARGVARYVAVTLWWWLFTQWCFGMPIMDRVFVLTGGQCVVIDEHPKFPDVAHLFNHQDELSAFTSKLVTSYACRKVSGSWQGGHDPLGHVFLMVHASLYMFMEGEPTWLGWGHFVALLKLLSNQIRAAPNFPAKSELVLKFVLRNPHVLLMGLISLWWGMLFMTNVYFHSILEKFVGLVFGFAAIIPIYILPRWLQPPVEPERQKQA